MKANIIITGGAGFIDSNLVRHVFENTNYHIIVADKLTYAGNVESIADLLESRRVELEQCDIADRRAMADVF